MPSTITPSWTDSGTTIIAPQCLARGNNLRATVDLRTVFGARIHTAMGRGGTTAVTAPGAGCIVRQIPNNGALRNLQPWGSMFMTAPASGAIVKLINNGPGYGAGVTSFTVDGTGTPVMDEWYCMWGVTAIPANATALTTAEFVRCSNFATNVLYTDAPTLYAHADNEILTNRAEMGLFDLPGGSVYEIIFDYLSHAAGESIAIAAWSQTYNSNSAS